MIGLIMGVLAVALFGLGYKLGWRDAKEEQETFKQIDTLVDLAKQVGATMSHGTR